MRLTSSTHQLGSLEESGVVLHGYCKDISPCEGKEACQSLQTESLSQFRAGFPSRVLLQAVGRAVVGLRRLLVVFLLIIPCGLAGEGVCVLPEVRAEERQVRQERTLF